MFLKNCWYVAAWAHELPEATPIGRVIIGEPVAIYRRTDGSLAALADRCAHRKAPLSKGRVESDGLRCMYHGLKYGADGRCIEGPGMERIPPHLKVRTFPVVAQDGWLWVWMGDPGSADASLIPRAWGLDDPRWVMTPGQIEYAANYELVNDNLTDLSHVDFVHETTLARNSGVEHAKCRPSITTIERGLHISRWFQDQQPSGPTGPRMDIRSTYRYLVPGVFVMRTDGLPVGTAENCAPGEPDSVPSLFTLVEQQAVTPIDAQHTRYFFATGTTPDALSVAPEILEARMAVIRAAFAEDRAMIEAQQRIIDLTPDFAMGAIPQDRGPMLMRGIIERLIKSETGAAA